LSFDADTLSTALTDDIWKQIRSLRESIGLPIRAKADDNHKKPIDIIDVTGMFPQDWPSRFKTFKRRISEYISAQPAPAVTPNPTLQGPHWHLANTQRLAGEESTAVHD
jgi:hypothetical protein